MLRALFLSVTSFFPGCLNQGLGVTMDLSEYQELDRGIGEWVSKPSRLNQWSEK